MTGRRKPQLQDLFANAAYEAILFMLFFNNYGIAVFRDSSFVRMTGRRKPQLQDLFANAAYEAILFLLLFK